MSDDILGKVRITQLDCAPLTLRPGETCALTFAVTSRATDTHTVWLGASAQDQAGAYHFNVEEDVVVTLAPGEQLFSRALTIPRTAAPGVYRVVGALWLGAKSQPDASECLAVLDRGAILTVA